MSDMNQPLVTIAMPCLNEEGYIEQCLQCVFDQDYPADRIEILVADGGSHDRTLEILRKISQKDERVRVIHNPERIQAAGMNEMIAISKGEIIIRMDVHCEYASDYVSQCVSVLQRTGADNVGGSQRSVPKTFFQRALTAALTSPMGVGGAKYRDPNNEGYVDTVHLGAFRRKIFEIVGMYDRKAITNEDAELNQRILDAGGKVFLSRDIKLSYFPRASFSALAKQYFKYGQGRARTLLKHGKFVTIRPAIPFLAVVGGTFLLLTSPIQPFTPTAFGFYAAATGAEAIRVGRKEGWLAVPVVWGIFPVLHASHGLGFGLGLVKYTLNPDWTEIERLAGSDHSHEHVRLLICITII
jgi:succinoglycan biosynthesis protein ExoA